MNYDYVRSYLPLSSIPSLAALLLAAMCFLLFPYQSPARGMEGSGNLNLSLGRNPFDARPDAAGPSLSITAYSQDGKNTGNAQLGLTVTFVAAVQGTTNTGVTWVVQGPGSITSAGVYTAPDLMPTNPAVVVNATLTSNPGVGVSYPMTLVNGVPAISHAIPKPLVTAMSNVVTIQGAGFVPGTTLTANGKSYPVTYQSSTQVLAQIAVGATDSGTLQLVAANPAPGGGASPAYAEPIAVPTISLVAYSQDGQNTGNAPLGTDVTIVPAVQGTGATALTWTLAGPGALSNSGVYSVPASMPGTTAATVTAALVSNPAISTTYRMTMSNPVPNIAHATPKPVNTAATNSVTLSGSGFTPGMTVKANGQPLSVSYQSSTSATVQITVSATATGTLNLIATNPSPAGGSSTPYPETIAVPTISLVAYSQDGKNTGDAPLGTNVTIVPTVQGSGATSVTWSLNGPGSISNSGVYTVPASMPGTATATVTAALTSNAAITATYSMKLTNPIPSIAHATPKPVNTAATNAVTLTGTGFVPGMTVTANGSPLSITYQSPTSALAQIPVSATASGTLNLVATNPGPGGGASPAYPETIAVPAISLVAYSQDGKNTGNAQLGTNVTVVPTVSGSGATGITWNLHGPGTISASGVYSVPPVMPATSSATITAALASNPSISVTYSMNLVNPVATIYSANPSSLVATATSVSLSGTGFVAGSSVLVNGKAAQTTYNSPNTLTAMVDASAQQSGSVSVVVSNPAPMGGSSAAITLAVAVPGVSGVSPTTLNVGPTTLAIYGANFTNSSQVYVNGNAVATTYVSATKLTAGVQVAPWSAAPVTVAVAAYSGVPASPSINVPVNNPNAGSYDAAARFSMQAAFGPRPDVVAHIQQIGAAAYLTEQFAQPVSSYTVAPDSYKAKSDFFLNALNGNNLLRQRVAFALENFIAVAIPNDAASYAEGVPWQLMMEKDAFGNFRDLLTDVTMNATMGVWLNLGNNWASSDPAVHPNQNYARELMQLFTMGTVQLNDDGTVVTDSSGNPVPNYDDNTVFDLSRALTGWGLPPADGTNFVDYGIDFNRPLAASESQHDHGQKTLFGSVVLPANQTIQQDRDAAIDAVFNRPSVPAFVSKLLIQHLVKSNPTPAYVQRISNVFKNDGSGVRGNLQAVISAILLDSEARCGDTPSCVSASPNTPKDGHLQDPVLFILSVMNGLQIAPIVPEGATLINITAQLGQNIWRPDSVFSFYSPSFLIPGTSINAPEFQLDDGNFAIQRAQVLISMFEGNQAGIDTSYRTNGWLVSSFPAIPDLLEGVNHMFYHGQMPSSTMSSIASYAQSVQGGLGTQQATALYLALNSDTFQIAK